MLRKAYMPLLALALLSTPARAAAGPIVEMQTSEGMIVIELNEEKAPVTVKNFLSYVNDGFYDGTVFHRVIKDFMIQGGGFVSQGGKLVRKETKAPIVNEAKNGLKNERGAIAMARTMDPNSATSQFFINHVGNPNLDYPKPDGHGYAVFGKVIEGIEVVDKIAAVATGTRDMMADVPVKDVVIQSVKVRKGQAAPEGKLKAADASKAEKKAEEKKAN